MKRSLVACMLLCALFGAPAFAANATVNVNLNAPPPPTITVQPHWVTASRGVYVTSDPSLDYDIFRVGSTYYVYQSGSWYRARTWSGPYVAVQQQTVPRTVFMIPESRYQWHGARPQWSPGRRTAPGQVKKSY